jgi:hypothetical protein
VTLGGATRASYETVPPLELLYQSDEDVDDEATTLVYFPSVPRLDLDLDDLEPLDPTTDVLIIEPIYDVVFDLP